MIPVLYKANSTNFDTFGIGVLKDCTSCEVTEERNGAFECVLKYPISGALYKEICTERLVKAKPNDTAKDQVFRIYRVSTPINGQITVYAQHLSYDLSNIATLQWQAESISPALAMERVFQNTATAHNFTCQTDYSAAKAFSVVKPQSVRACLGGVAGSFLDLWGGEYEWDNFHVIHHQGRGKHTGVVIEYGKNLTDLEHDNENTDVYTDLLPYAVVTAEDGTETAVTLPEVLLPISDTTLVQRKTLIRDFTEYFDEENPVTVDGLRAYANNYLKNNPLGTATPTLTVAFEPLWKQPEYAAVLERVSLCDTVTIRHSLLGITAKAKVITTVYDTLAEKYISISLGSAKANLLNNVSAAEAAAEDASAKVDRFPVLMNSAIKNATGLITGQTGGYDIEAEMQLTFNGSISPITVSGTQKNSLLYVQYRYKLTSASSYGSYTSILSSVTQSGTSFSFSNLELCSLDANSSYDFHIYIRDQLNTLSALSLYFTVPQGTPLVALRKKMVGINTPTPDSALHVVGDGHFEGDVRIEGTLTLDNLDYDFGVPPFYYGTCATAAATVAKVVTCSGFVLETGATIAVKFTYYNTGASPTLNVNSTGAIAIKQYGSTAASTYMWRSGEVVLFVYNGSYWELISKSTATTTYYGLTKLSSSVTSTSTTLAATASAVKQAYDRQDFEEITLETALAVAYGGTGATTAAAARTNLGITCTSLYSGTLTTGSTTFNYGSYKAYVIIGQPNSTSARVSLFIPKGQLTTTATTYQLADETNYYTFNLSYSGSTVTLAYKGRSGSGQVLRVFGVN